VLIVVGLDGASYKLCEQWIEQGWLPNLARIRREGCWMPLESTIPSVSPVAWSSFMTGSNPGHHGVFGFFVPERPAPHAPPTRFRPVNARDCHGKRFWEEMNQRGISTGIVGVPVTYPVSAVDGHMVAGLLSPKLSAAGATYPADLAAAINAEVGPYRITPRGLYVPGNEESFAAELHTCLELRARLAEYLLDRHRCAVHIFVLYETDVAQHKFWQFMDSSHPRYQPDQGRRWGHIIRDVYAHADAIVGELIEQLGPGDDLVVMSDHGAGPLHGTVHLNKWLREEGYLYCNPGLHQCLMRLAAQSRIVQTCARIASRLRLGRYLHLTHALQRLLASGFLHSSNINWSRTSAYNLGFQGAVYTVGESYQQIGQEIAAHLLALRDPATGQRVIESVHHADQLYTGPHLAYAPILLLESVGGLYSASQKAYAPCLMSLGIDSGAHRRTGIFGMLGKGVKLVPTKQSLHIETIARLLVRIACNQLA